MQAVDSHIICQSQRCQEGGLDSVLVLQSRFHRTLNLLACSVPAAVPQQTLQVWQCCLVLTASHLKACAVQWLSALKLGAVFAGQTRSRRSTTRCYGRPLAFAAVRGSDRLQGMAKLGADPAHCSSVELPVLSASLPSGLSA